MQVMKSVAQKNFTMWSSVYDLSNGKFEFAYRQHYDNDYADRLSEFDNSNIGTANER